MQDRAVPVKNQKGFSLVEVLVIIGIASVMIAISMPSIISQITHLRLTRSVRNVVTELNAARLKAIAQNKSFQVEFTVNAGTTPPDTYQLKSYTGGAWVVEPDRALGRLEPGISITSPGGPTFSADFNANGSASSTIICVNNAEKTNDRMKITVKTATGRILVETGC